MKESHDMVEICWKPILSAISFGWLNSNSEELNHSIAEVYLNYIPLCHVLGHAGPRYFSFFFWNFFFFSRSKGWRGQSFIAGTISFHRSRSISFPWRKTRKPMTSTPARSLTGILRPFRCFLGSSNTSEMSLNQTGSSSSMPFKFLIALSSRPPLWPPLPWKPLWDLVSRQPLLFFFILFYFSPLWLPFFFFFFCENSQEPFWRTLEPHL